MTISSTTNKIQYTGNGVTTSFSFPYIFFATTDLQVTLHNTTTDVDVTPVPVLNGAATYDYMVSGTLDPATGEYLSGGNIVFNTAPPANFRVTIQRNLTFLQLITLIDNNKFPAATVNGALDRLTIFTQQLLTQQSQALTQPPSDPSPIGLLPTVTTRANSVLGFDVNGDPYAAQVGTGSFVASSYVINTIFPLASAAAFRTALNVPAVSEAISPTIFAAKGDLLAATGNDVPAILSVGADGSVPMARSAATAGLAYVSPFAKHISGLTYANNSGTPNTQIDVAAGAAMDSTNAYWMALGSTLTKKIDAVWAVGTGNGGLDTGSVADNDYYIWLIARPDTGAVDALFSLSSTAPTMPSSYTFKRLIGWFKRATNIVAFHTYELEGGGLAFNWDSARLDLNTATLTTARVLTSLSVPLNFSTLVTLNASIVNASTPTSVRVCCPDQLDVAPLGWAAPGAPMFNVGYNVSANFNGSQVRCRTSATGQVASRGFSAIAGFALVTEGFEWSRR